MLKLRTRESDYDFKISRRIHKLEREAGLPYRTEDYPNPKSVPPHLLMDVAYIKYLQAARDCEIALMSVPLLQKMDGFQRTPLLESEDYSSDEVARLEAEKRLWKPHGHPGC